MAQLIADGGAGRGAEKEKAIYRAQMEGSGKPANVTSSPKIGRGQAGSFYAQVALLDQASHPPIQRPPVSDVIGAANKALGSAVTVTRFARLKVGEAA